MLEMVAPLERVELTLSFRAERCRPVVGALEAVDPRDMVDALEVVELTLSLWAFVRTERNRPIGVSSGRAGIHELGSGILKYSHHRKCALVGLGARAYPMKQDQ